MNKTVIVIGSGFSSLATACYLSKFGYEVTVFEKNSSIGGRARQFKKNGFTFDMGPTWYWMPDVFERFFSDFNTTPNAYYKLEKLNPAYQVYFGKDDVVTIEDSIEKIKTTFEKIEVGSSKALDQFITKAKSNYDIAIKDLVYNPGVSPLELITPKTILKLKSFFTTITSDVAKLFSSQKLKKILEFPVLFLGAKPSNTPGFYSFMNYADFGLGTYHPKGGMFNVIKGIAALAESLGVKIITNQTVEKFEINDKTIKGVYVNSTLYTADIIVSGADYHHTESLLPKALKQYSAKYWDKKVLAPSSLLFYVGFDKPINNVTHHSLFFDTDFDAHASAIYDTPKWPENPMFYASFPSKTDTEIAPKGQEAGVFLIPLAPDLEDTEALRNRYFEKIITRLELLTDQSLRPHILFKESFGINDFKTDYNSYKGNAYGLANTLLQTAFLRPKLKSKLVKNLYFTGQLTVPGPGLPPSLISGKLVAELVKKHHTP